MPVLPCIFMYVSHCYKYIMYRFIIIKYCVQVFNPDSIHGSIKYNPLPVLCAAVCIFPEYVGQNPCKMDMYAALTLLNSLYIASKKKLLQLYYEGGGGGAILSCFQSMTLTF